MRHIFKSLILVFNILITNYELGNNVIVNIKEIMNKNMFYFFRLIKNYSIYFIKIRLWKLLGCDTYAKIFKRNVLKHPNKIAFKHEGSSWRYIEVNIIMATKISVFKIKYK